MSAHVKPRIATHFAYPLEPAKGFGASCGAGTAPADLTVTGLAKALIQGAGIYHGGDLPVANQDNEQIRDHGGLTFRIEGVKVVTAVANGDLNQRLTVQAKGEVAALADTINNMTGTLATFADQVTNVAREVGVEGRLGGQANVPGAAGTWKDLTGNVNLLATNLTSQVRAIAEVATAGCGTAATYQRRRSAAAPPRIPAARRGDGRRSV
jgi:HAMP domain